jgi:hypothetical protein
MMPNVKQLLAAVSLVLPAVSDASAQDRRLTTRLDSATAAQVTRLVDSVRVAGLPADPLIGVALEGATRRASAERIVGAVREYAAALGSARQALGERAQSDEIVSGAGVIVAGVTPTAVESIRAARPTGLLTVPLVVLADLVARGVPADSAAATVADALRNGARDDELSEFRRRVERDILAGAKPTTAMSIRTRDLPGGRSRGMQPPRMPNAPRMRRPGPR